MNTDQPSVLTGGGTRKSFVRRFASRSPRLPVIFLSVFLLVPSAPVSAFPPAPHHLFYGLIRDEFGSPLPTGAEVILETASGKRFKNWTISGLGAGVNYQLPVPMDSGSSADLYQPTALRPSVSFRITVRINGITFLPIEMTGDFRELGKVAGNSRVDLTLGVDSDGDGLPDAWERLIDSDLSKVGPQGDADDDRMNNLQEYLAGTYAFDAANGLNLKIIRFHEGRPVMEFLGVTGRTYSIQGSQNLKQWEAATFRVLEDGEAGKDRTRIRVDEIRKFEIEVVAGEGDLVPRYYRVMVE
jgi:hypothetical protein